MNNIKVYLNIFLFILLIGSANAQWVELNTGLAFHLWTASAVDDNVVWVAGGTTNVFRTTNGGLNWTNVSGTGMGSRGVTCIFALDANNALLGTGNGQLLDTACIYKTTNGGQTWVLTWGELGTFIDGIYMKNSNEAFFVGDPDCPSCSMILRKSSDGGSSWAIAAIFGAGNYGTTNSIFGVGDQIWVGTTGVNYTTNFGTNWSHQSITGFNYVYSICFENSLTGICGGPSGMNFTTNSGISWTALTYPGTGYVNGIAGYGNIWIITKFGRNAYITTDNGVSWNLDYTIPQTTNRNFMTKSRNGSKLWDVRDDGTVGRRDSPVGIQQLSGNVPDKFELTQNFPNPFNPETKVRFNISHNSKVMIAVYDMDGKVVSVIADRDFSVGSYEISFYAAGLASGVYYYKMEAGDYSKTKKMVLLK